MSEKPETPDREELEQKIRELEASGEYVVLRRVGTFRERTARPGAVLKRAAFVDVETTGLNAATDEIIELAVVPFDYDHDTGEIIRLHEPFSGLRDPGRPIPARVTELTGITDADVKDRSIDREQLLAVLKPVNLLVAHNAGFDRPFLERFDEVFAGKHWACSVNDVSWAQEGVNAGKLEYLAMAAGFFYAAHRATDDCIAALTILAEPLPRSGRPAFASLLENARKATLRFEAREAPFEAKDVLKARGYRWNRDERHWWKDVPEEAGPAEQAWLSENVYRGARAVPEPLRFTALERYSDRDPA